MPIIPIIRSYSNGGKNWVHIDSLPEELQNMIDAQITAYAADVINASGAMYRVPEIRWSRVDATDKDAFDEFASDLEKIREAEIGFVQSILVTKAKSESIRGIPFIFYSGGYYFNVAFEIDWGYDAGAPSVIDYNLFAALIYEPAND